MRPDANDASGEPEEWFKALLESLPGAAYVADPIRPGRWSYLSPQAEEIFGYSAAELMADPALWEGGLHPEDAPAARAARPSVPAGELRRVEYRFTRPDGREVRVLDEGITRTGPGGEQVCHGQLRDVTCERRGEVRLRSDAGRQRGLAELGERALAGTDIEELIETAVGVAARLDGATQAFAWERPDGGDVLMLRAALQMPSGGAGWRALSADRSTHVAAVAETAKPLVVDDWESEERWSLPAAARERGVRSSVAVPIEVEGRIFGVLDVHSTQPGAFDTDSAGFLDGVARILSESHRRGQADEELRRETLNDPLTGLPNRLLFVEEADRALGRAFAAASSVAVLFCDLDRFKLINDSLGHTAGDELLRAVAPRLRAQLRPGDLVGRFAGDEFGILLTNISDASEAQAVARRVLESFSKGFLINGVEHFVNISIGIALAQPGTARAGDAEAMIRDADAAMYKAKEAGRSRWEVYDHTMRARATKRLAVERELHRALEKDELVAHYQPVVDLRRREITGFEALVRWEHPQRGLLPPAEFISVAEDAGLIAAVGDWVLGQACTHTLAWNAMRPDRRPLEISVNLSPRQLAHPEIRDSVSAALRRTGMPAEQVRLEITESLLVEESGVADAALNALEKLGVRLVLDDFGTGYSSLAYLNRFPISALKIDRSFVMGMEAGSTERGAIVQAIIGMSRALSLEVIGEGVETEYQLGELERMECDYAQGFLFSQPVPAEQVIPFLSAWEAGSEHESHWPHLDERGVKPVV